jgi:hypothetical protein
MDGGGVEEIWVALRGVLQKYYLDRFCGEIYAGPHESPSNLNIDDGIHWILQHDPRNAAFVCLWPAQPRPYESYWGCHLDEQGHSPEWVVGFFHECYDFFEGQEPFCDDLSNLAKEIFVRLHGDLAFADEEGWSKTYGSLLQPLEAGEPLTQVPTSQDGHRPWFYILNRDHWERSKQYANSWGAQRIESLDDGSVFIFVQYPYDFDVECKKHSIPRLIP